MPSLFFKSAFINSIVQRIGVASHKDVEEFQTKISPPPSPVTFTSGKELTSKNYSCFNNLGTIHLCSDLVQDLKTGLEIKVKLIESSCFVDFVHNVADQTVSVDTKVQIEKFINLNVQIYT